MKRYGLVLVAVFIILIAIISCRGVYSNVIKMSSAENRVNTKSSPDVSASQESNDRKIKEENSEKASFSESVNSSDNERMNENNDSDEKCRVEERDESRERDEDRKDRDERESRYGDKSGFRDFVKIFGTGTLDEGLDANDVVLIGSEGTIRGNVKGDCVVVGGKLHLKHGASVSGDLVSVFSSVDKDRDVLINGSQVNIGSYESTGIPGFIKGILSAWDLMIALILLLVSWRFVNVLTDRLQVNPGSAFMTGFLGLICFVPLIIILAISIIGIVMIPILPLFYIVGFGFGFAVMANLMGDKIADLMKKDVSQPVRAIIGLISILILLKIISLFPILGGLTAEVIKMIMRTVGLGLIIGVLWQAIKRKGERGINGDK